MLKIAAALLSFLALAAAALAEPASLSFGGDRLVEKYGRSGPQAAIIEFVPPDQTLDNWTSLVGFRGLWESKGTAADAAAALARVTSERYPSSKPRILAKGSEAMVVFVAAPPNDDLVEFNVFKYGPTAAASYRSRTPAVFRGLDPEDVRRLGERWVGEAATFDLSIVHAALRAPSRLSLARPPE